MYSRYDTRYTTRYSALRRSLSRRRRERAIALLLLIVLVVSGTAFVVRAGSANGFTTFSGSGEGSVGASVVGSTQGSADESGFASTPVDQWQKGEIPILYQQDPQWSSQQYAGTSFGLSGCGPTCLAMVAIYLTGDTSSTPVKLAEMATTAGLVSAEGTDWSFMIQGAQTLGFSARELPASKDLIISCLDAGDPIIAVVGPGDFTTTGHFIVLTGVNPDGTISVHDPNSVERTQQSWDLDRLMPQFRDLWVY